MSHSIIHCPDWQNIPNLQHGMFLRSVQATQHSKSIFQRIDELHQEALIPNSPIITADQVHGEKIAVIHQLPPQDNYTENPHHHHYEITQTDALITSCANITLCIRTADCQPVLLVDPLHQIIGAAHCGWRGVWQELAAKTAQKMIQLGATPQTLRIWIGPAISQENYEVSDDLIQQFKTKFPMAAAWNQRQLSLQKITEWQLRQLGISQISISNDCTFANQHAFHSYRREGKETGRLLTYIRLESTADNISSAW